MAIARRILVPIDFSEPSDAALRYGADLARTFGATLHVLHAFEDPYAAGALIPEVYGYVPDEWRVQALGRAEEQALKRLQSVAHDIPGCTAKVVPGAAAKTIVQYAKDHDIDLIVMATHGRGGVMHLLIGGVTEKVVRTAHCPVLAMRSRQANEGRAREASGLEAARA